MTAFGGAWRSEYRRSSAMKGRGGRGCRERVSMQGMAGFLGWERRDIGSQALCRKELPTGAARSGASRALLTAEARSTRRGVELQTNTDERRLGGAIGNA